MSIDRIKENLNSRMGTHVNSLCATEDEVTIAWLICEFDTLTVELGRAKDRLITNSEEAGLAIAVLTADRDAAELRGRATGMREAAEIIAVFKESATWVHCPTIDTASAAILAAIPTSPTSTGAAAGCEWTKYEGGYRPACLHGVYALIEEICPCCGKSVIVKTSQEPQ